MLSLLILVLATAVDARRRPQPPREITATCVNEACHTGILGRPVMHAPAARQKCLTCHEFEEPREHRFKLAEDPSTLCTTCHLLSHRTFVHEPVRQGQCTGCHDPHGSDRHAILLADPTGGLCLQCHAQIATADFVHEPVQTGACILCHEAHSAWQPQLLTASRQELCLECHADVGQQSEVARHRHPPVEEDCLACHDAHGSDAEHQLRQDAPDLCMTCHREVGESIASAAVVHGAVIEAGGCRACHAGHGSAWPALQRGSETETCLRCHDRVLFTPKGRPVTNMAALLKDNPDHHGPVRDGACSACHWPHAAEHPQLLRKAYPAEFYAAFDQERYALCFECHIAEMVTSERGTGLTRFRDGDLNLHWLHVNRPKGRTCRACHEVHASKNPFHMRDSVPFGSTGWKLEIQYDMTETGGSCTPGCHGPTRYSRGLVDEELAAPGPPTGARP